VQRQIGKHQPEAVGELLDQRLPLAVGEQLRVHQRERWARAGLAVGDSRAVVVVVETKPHAGATVPWPAVLRSPHDRRIFALAVPALGALAAEPLYILVDTAIVGHLGTPQLAALAIAATVLATAFTVFNFLTYGTTAHVARLHGAGRGKEAALVGAQALWLGVGIGLVLLVAVVPLAPLAVQVMGGEGEVARQATLYLRIRGARRAVLHARDRGQGFLRGIGDLRTPLRSWSSPTRSTWCSRCCSSTASAGGSRARRGAR
jgi:hypothetical protein